MDRHPPSADQHVLAAFIQEGYLERHIRRIRNVYAENRRYLIDMIERYIPKHLGYLQAGDQGMHMVLWLAHYMDDRKIAQAVLDAGIAIKAVSPTFSLERKRSGLVLGLGDFELIQMECAVQSLANILKQYEQPLEME